LNRPVGPQEGKLTVDLLGYKNHRHMEQRRHRFSGGLKHVFPRKRHHRFVRRFHRLSSRLRLRVIQNDAQNRRPRWQIHSGTKDLSREPRAISPNASKRVPKSLHFPRKALSDVL
jgi:hypothetical protein